MVIEAVPFTFPLTGRMEVLEHLQGFSAEFHYQNGRSAVVSRNDLTGGGRHGLFSLAMISQETGRIISCPEIHGESDEPIGWLTDREVSALLDQIAALPSRL